MKTKTLISFFFALVVAFGFSACDDDAQIILFSDSEVIDEIGTCTNTVSSLELYLNGRESADIGIANGKEGYSAHSSDESVVTATVNNDRLLLNSHGKKGKITITVSDKKGNSVVLPVTVAYGGVKLLGIQAAFVISVDGEILRGEDNKQLIESVNEAMAPYAFIKEEETCILQPNDVNKILANGSFKYSSENGKILAEGTYRSEYDDEWITGEQSMFLNFSYQGSKGVVNHKFYFEPKLKSEPTTRETGPVKMYWAQDVTQSSYLDDITLPDNGKVLYVVFTSAYKLRAIE